MLMAVRGRRWWTINIPCLLTISPSFSYDQDAYHCLLYRSDGLHRRYVPLFDHLRGLSIITGPDLTTTSLPLGAVLADLVQAYPDIRVTALVRNLAHSAALKANNKVVDVVEGSFSDIALITSKAREADITFNTGDSDDVPLTKAILAGQKQRVTEDSKPPAALVHISGVAVFADGTTDGKHDPNAKVWNVRARSFYVTVHAHDRLIFHG